MSGVRWTTAVGIALGGVGGAAAALLGAPEPPTAAPSYVRVPGPSTKAPAAPLTAAPAAVLAAPAAVAAAVATASSEPSAAGSAMPILVAPPIPSGAPLAATSLVEPTARPTTGAGAAELAPPTTHDGLMKAMLYCDQRKDFDECGRAARALEQGTAGTADAAQGRRFRRIAMTHIVRQCDGGLPHACFVLAAKYRSGADVVADPSAAEVLEKRALDLCRVRTAPECPSAHSFGSAAPAPLK